ncbi:MAG: hypothetical protein ABI790_05345 [Betaproteobacteria bacterium]
MSNRAIIKAWQAVVCVPGLDQAEALRQLNEELGTAYTASRLGEWRNGRRPMPDAVRAYMLAIGIGWLLHKHGIRWHDPGDAVDGLAADLA